MCLQIDTTTEIQLCSTINKTTKMSLDLNKEKIKRWNLACQKRESLALPCNIWLGKLCHWATVSVRLKKELHLWPVHMKDHLCLLFSCKEALEEVASVQKKWRQQNYQIIFIFLIEGLVNNIISPPNKATGDRRLFLQGNAKNPSLHTSNAKLVRSYVISCITTTKTFTHSLHSFKILISYVAN